MSYLGAASQLNAGFMTRSRVSIMSCASGLCDAERHLCLVVTRGAGFSYSVTSL